MMTKVLVTGASGLLGANLVYEARHHYDVIALSHTHPLQLQGVETVMIDLSVPENVARIIDQYKPDWVIHCAAYTNVDQCEENQESAFLLNCDMSRWIAQATQASGGCLIYISTDAVFKGFRSGYREGDVPEPINVYAQSKLAGEQVAREENPNAMIIRTNFYGWNAVEKKSLAEWFLARLKGGKVCRGFTDVFVKILLVNDLVDLLLQMLEKRCEGLYHVLGKDCVSKYDFGVQLARVFKLDESLIHPVEVDQVGLSAPRPKNLCLDTSKIRDSLNIEMPSLEDGLNRFHELDQKDYPKSLKSLIGE
jgi:dTDP-4-dehydrorhamnose reductase